MSSSQIQKLLDESNLDLQQLSEKTGLSVNSLQSFEQEIQTGFDTLDKISAALDMPSSEVLSRILDSSCEEREHVFDEIPLVQDMFSAKDILPRLFRPKKRKNHNN